MFRDFLAGNLLAHTVTFGDFMAGNFLAGEFLGWILIIYMINRMFINTIALVHR